MLKRIPFTRTAKHLAVLGAAFSMLAGCASDDSIRNFSAKNNAAILATPRALVSNPEVKAYMSKLASEVLGAAKARRTVDPQKDGWIYDKFDAAVVLSKDANAFVTGDDVVFVHSGLLSNLERPEQLMAILTHEFSHNELRHMKSNIEAMQRQTGMALVALAGAVAGVAGGGDLAQVGSGVAAGASGAMVVDGAFTRSFGRKEELAADKSGLELYARMGYDPAHFQRVFEIFREKYGDGSGSGTHPRNSERIKQVQEARASLPAPTAAQKSLDVAEFQRIRAIVAQLERSAPEKTFVGNAKFKDKLMSCFDYCHAHEKSAQKQTSSKNRKQR